MLSRGAVATIVCRGEGAGEDVLPGTASGSCDHFFRHGHRTAVVRGARGVHRHVVAAFHRVVGRNRSEFRSRRVFHRDGLNRGRSIATSIRGGERPRDRVVACAISFQHRFHLFQGEFAAVVGRRSRVVHQGIAALGRVVGWNGQFRRGGVLNLNHLHVHACVSTNVRDRPTALQDVSLRTSPIVANLLAVRDVQVARAVVRGRNRFGALHGWNVSTLHRHVGGTVHNGWRGHVVALHRDELGQNAAALVDGLKDELGVFVALCIVGAAFQIHHNVSTQSGNVFAVQLTFPAEPSAKSLVAVVVVGAYAKLKALGVRHGHVVQEQRALVVACARQSAQHLHVED